MAVAFDAKATADTHLTPPLTANSPLVNNGLTIGAGATALVATVTNAVGAGALATITGVTWNGVTMTLLSTKTQSDNLGQVSLYVLASPATGNHTLAVSFTGANTNASLAVDCASFSGTDTTTANAFPTANVVTDASTTGGAVYPATAFSVTTVNGDMVVGSFTNNTTDFSTLTAGTFLRDDIGLNDGLVSWGFNAAAGTTTTFQWSGGSAGVICCGIAIRIAQPGGGGGGTGDMWYPSWPSIRRRVSIVGAG